MENENNILTGETEVQNEAAVNAEGTDCNNCKEEAFEGTEVCGESFAEGELFDAEGEACEDEAENAAEEPEKKPGAFKRLIKKWWFWAIVGVVVVGLTIGIVAIVNAATSSDSSSSSSSSYYTNPYVTMVKTATNSNYGITYGAAFDSFFTNTEWSYFKATTGENVVEFEGDFLYSGALATAKIQFIVDTASGTLSVYHLSIDGVDQNKLMLATLVQKVFESY